MKQEVVQGKSLAEMVASGMRASEEEVLRIATDLLATLKYLSGGAGRGCSGSSVRSHAEAEWRDSSHLVLHARTHTHTHACTHQTHTPPGPDRPAASGDSSGHQA
jgi:hypothetical protein